MFNIMKPQLSTNAVQRILCAAALILSTAVASASSSVITFQIDMTVAISNSIFNPATQTVAARGMFNGWPTPGYTLTNNPNGANTNLYTGTYNDTLDANGALSQYQFVTVTGTTINAYSSQVDGNNYIIALPTNSGGTVVIPTVFWSEDGPAETNNVSFTVDMAEQLHLGNFVTSYTVACQGSFEGWSTPNFLLTNNPALNQTNGQGYITSYPYQGTYAVSASPGAMAEYKFVYNDGVNNHYEAPKTGDPQNSGNRFFRNVPQTVPTVSFSDAPFSDTVTNNVTFIVDMSVQTFDANFDPSTNTIQIYGDYNNWNSGTIMSNTNSANTNLYYASISYTNGAGSAVYFKYQIDPGGDWENPAASNLIGGNRYYTMAATSGNFTDGPVYFSDTAPPPAADTVSVSNCMVTFTVDMTAAVNGSVDPDLSFTEGFDTVGLNGLSNGVVGSFWAWGSSGNTPANYEMTWEGPNIGNGNLYTITLPVNQGQPLNIYYDYGIDGGSSGSGNEPNGNHSHYIRSLPNYTMPTDVFGSPAPGEASFGNLTYSNTAANITLTWLGRTGVSLQSTTNLNPPIVWTPLPLTDGTNLQVAQGPGNTPPVGYATTNFPIVKGSNLFFELIGPP